MEIGTQEYYRTTVLQGFFDDNDREFLVEYFVREFKKAEKESYSAEVFFSGCIKPLGKIKSILNNLFNDRKRELYMLIDMQRSKVNNENKEEDLQEKIESFQQELKELKESGFNTPVQLKDHPRLSMQFNTKSVEYIEASILKAHQKVSTPMSNSHLSKDEENVLQQYQTKKEKVTFNFTQTEIIELTKALIQNGNIKGKQKEIIQIVSSFFETEVNNQDKIITDLSKRNNGSETLFLDKLKTSLNEFLSK